MAFEAKHENGDGRGGNNMPNIQKGKKTLTRD